jgi:hypothetical protein
MKTLWYRPTLLDLVRICHVAGINAVPLQLLVTVDNHDHKHSKRYIESQSLNESESVYELVYGHNFRGDLELRKGHFANERWSLLTKDYKKNADLGYLVYKVKLAKNIKNATSIEELKMNTGTNYIFSTGVLFGYDQDDSRLQTVYYIEPCEVVYQLNEGETSGGNPSTVNMRLMWACFQNLVQKKAFAGHQERRQSSNRR